MDNIGDVHIPDDLFRSLVDNETKRGRIVRNCLPRDDRCGDVFPNLEEAADIPIIPRSQWDEHIENNNSLETLVSKIKDQNGEGTCASNASTQCAEIVANMSYGKRIWIELSPISIYRWIAPGPNTGSTISGNLKQLRDVGALPVNNERNRKILEKAGLDPGHMLKAVGYYQNFPTGWKETARYFTAFEWFDIASFEGFVSALFYDFPVCYGRAGHAITGVNAVKRNGVYHVKYANSWGDWGDAGYGYDSESYISRAISSYGAWALRAVKVHDIFIDLLQDTEFLNTLSTAA